MIGKFPKVGPRVYGGFDADAQAFITAASITDPTQQSAINTLVVGMKNQGLWTKMKAVYPFVGGTATSHKFNLKDPRDLDAAFRLTFYGTWTHTSLGAQPNGVNGYADTFLTSASLNQNSNHCSIYSRTNQDRGEMDMGAFNASIFGVGFGPKASNIAYLANYDDLTSGTQTAPSNTLGLLLSTRNSSTVKSFYKNASLNGNSNVNSSAVTFGGIFIGARRYINTPESYSSKQYAFATIGDGLTDTDASNFYTLVQNFNTTLNRQI